ncbi:MAG: UDP-glucose 4-epimerase [Bacteroidia bacterium]|jgi:nucleoside-diphosphate-sugar epimerase
MNILVTGASGFIGGFIVEKAISLGLNVFAAVRKSSSRKYLTDGKINFVEIDFTDSKILTEQLLKFKNIHGDIDFLIHNAGVTKVLSDGDYDKVNYVYTKNLVEAIINSKQSIKKFVFVSSLAASGPGKENTDIPIKLSDPLKPVTQYGRSKLKAEKYFQSLNNFPYVIMRPPAVFGPRDTDMYSVFKLIKNRLEVNIGGKLQYLSFIYVKDLAAALLEAATCACKEKTYFISDNKKYTNVVFSECIKSRMGVKTLVINLPMFLVKLVAFISEKAGKITRKPSPLNVDKINELECGNWLCDASDFYKDTGFKVQYSLEEGIAESINWYKKENWL